MNVNLDQIRAFLAVAHAESFTRAAEALHLTQPTLTVRIRRLEEALGIRLFDRTTRSVVLNRTGAELLPVFERMIDDLARVVEDARDLAEMRRGVVRIAALPSVAAAVLPGVIEQFRRVYPGASFIVQDLVADRVVDRLREGVVEIGISGGDRVPEGLNLVFRMSEAFRAVVPLGHPLAERESLARDDILLFPLVALTQSTSVRHVVDTWLRGANCPPTIACEATYMMSVAGMVSAGLGIALLPETAREVAAFPDLVSIPLSKPALARDILVLTREGRALSPMCEAFCQHLIGSL